MSDLDNVNANTTHLVIGDNCLNDASLEYGGKESSHVLLSKEASEMSGLDEDLDLVRVEIRNKDEINVDVNLLTVSVEPDSLMNVATSILNVVSCSPSDA